MEIFKLFGSILIDNDEANKSIGRTGKEADGLGTKLGNGIKSAAKFGAALVAAGAAAIGAMIGIANRVGQAADRILDLSAVTGMSTDEIQKWESVTKVAGVSADAVTSASQRFTRQLDAMSSESNKGNKALQDLSLSFDEISNMDADTRMDTMVKALSEIEDPTERARIGTDLFGGAWKEIAPIVDLGAEAMDNAKDSANIFSQEDLERANDFRIKMDQAKERVTFLAMELGMKLLPVAERLFDWIDSHMPTIEATIDAVFTFIGQAVEWVMDWLEKLIDKFTTWYEDNTETIEMFKDMFFAFVGWIQEKFEEVLEIMEVVWELIEALWDKYGDKILSIAEFAFENIKIVIDAALGVIRGIIDTVMALITGDWEGAWEGIKSIFSSIWEGMKELLPNLIDGLLGVMSGAFDKFKEIGSGMFNMVWEGMKGIWNSITSWVNEKVDWLKDKLTFWKRGTDEMDEEQSAEQWRNTPTIHGTHKDGLRYVPHDGYIAQLHQGERVLTKHEAREQDQGAGGQAPVFNITMNVQSVSEGLREIEFWQKKLATV